MKTALALVLALALSAAAEAQADELRDLQECMRRGYFYCVPPPVVSDSPQARKDLTELEERIQPGLTPAQRLELLRRALAPIRPLYCEVYRDGRWTWTSCH